MSSEESFKFNFFREPKTSNVKASSEAITTMNTECGRWIPASCAMPTDSEEVGVGGLLRRPFKDATKDLSEALRENPQNAQPKSSLVAEEDWKGLMGTFDVVKGSYEGGLKTWECSIDLVNYLKEILVVCEDKVPELPESVLEIGCGSALPSIFYAKSRPIQRLVLQDFNTEVLASITYPNVHLNGLSDVDNGGGCQIEYIYGDWRRLLHEPSLLPTDEAFDIILTSETIYRVEYYEVLLDIFQKALKPKGTVLLAAKDYYFGLGGSVAEFMLRARAGPNWRVERVRHITDCGVPRSILRLSKTN